MSLLTVAEIADLRGEIQAAMSSACTRQDAQANWANAGSFPCSYEEATPQTTGLAAFEGVAAGYGVNVVVPYSLILNSQDRLLVDGITLEVQRVNVIGSDGLAKRAACVRR